MFRLPTASSGTVCHSAPPLALLNPSLHFTDAIGGSHRSWAITPTQFERLRAALASRYRILREVGRGGMATVYLAEDVKHDRRVAVKVLRPELAAALGPERFLREIQIAAVLAHPRQPVNE